MGRKNRGGAGRPASSPPANVTPQALVEAVRGFILQDSPTPGRFEELAGELFLLHYRLNAAYRRICEGRGVKPSACATLDQIPHVPVSLFKYLRFYLEDLPAPRFVFETSGTTHGFPGRHYLADLSLYRLSVQRSFNLLVGPPPEGGFIFLGPLPEEAPRSSLSWMYAFLAEQSRKRDVFYARRGGAWDWQGVAAFAARRRPLLMFGPVSAFALAVEAFKQNGQALVLPQSSRLMLTGGWKGRGRRFSEAKLRRDLRRVFGIGAKQVLHEYGMTELASPAYRSGRAPYRTPWWCQHGFVGRAKASGPRPLTFCDLANVASMPFLMTEDLGLPRGEGFIFSHRLARAQLRGCSLAI